MNAKKTLMGCLLLYLGLAAGSEAQTVTLPAVADSTLKQSPANKNRGSDPTLELAGDGRVLVRFDQAAITAAVGSGRLVSASLELFVHSATGSWGSDGRPIEAHMVTAAWTEAGVTWNCAVDANPANNKLDCATPWNGGSFADDATDSVVQTSAENVWVPFDVTADVAAFLGGTPNQGWLIVKADDDQSGKADYGSREGTSAERPRLVLVVESAAHDQVPPSLAITSPSQPILVNDPAPAVVVEYSDGGSGVDLATLQVLVDGQDVTASCATGPQSASCHVPSLAAGSHTVQALLKDRTGNAAQASASFQLLLGPGPHVVTLQTVGDTYVRKGDANKNFGSEPILRVRESGQNRALVQFDGVSLANTLRGATVVSASLELHVEKNGRNWGKTGRTVDAHRLTSAWTETGATWNCANDSNPTNDKADCATQWVGGSFAATPTASVLHTRDLTGWVRYDVTADVAAFATETPDFGWLLKKTEETKSGRVDYDSRQGTPGEGPRLVVVFTTPTGGGDTTPPTLVFVEPSTNPVTGSLSPEIAVSFYDADSGVAAGSLALTLDGANLLPSCLVDQVSASCTPAPLAFGTHQVVASVRDAAGNVATASLAFELADLAPPAIAILSPVAGSSLSAASVEVVSTASDDSAIASVQVNGVVATRVDDEYHATVPLAEGFNQITAVATDASGKVSTASVQVFSDTLPPQVTIETPLAGQPVSSGVVRVLGVVTDAGQVLSVDANGKPASLSGTRFEVLLPVGPGSQTITVHALDAAGNLGTATVGVVAARVPAVTITSPADLSTIAATTVDVAGTVTEPDAVVAVNGLPAVTSGGTFVAHGVPLIEGGNLISATAISSGGAGSATINVVRDLSPPYLAIAAPADGDVVFEPSVTVSGLVNDLVAGTVNVAQASVTVNGVPATVENRSFLAPGIPLAPGQNQIVVEATDASGNRAHAAVTVTRAPAGTPHVALVAGDLQTAPIGMPLAVPLTVALSDAAGAPVVGRPVIFQVDGNDGTLAGGRRLIAATTDAAGRASTPFILGNRVGAQRVTASSVGFAGPAVFTAIATPGGPVLIVADDGTLQVGVTGQQLPRPLIATVTDAGFNRLEGVAVRFHVTRGHGNLGGGTEERVVTTDSDGRAIVPFVLSLEEGIANNRAEARIDGLVDSPVASFAASGRAAGDPAATSISGVVLDGSNQPVPGVTLRLLDTTLSTQADEQGKFLLTGAPAGMVKLIADGSTTTRPGSWPDLEFVLFLVPGRDNPLTMPVYLLPLDLAHGLLIDETHGGTVRLPAAPGFALEVPAGSVTFPGGGRSGTISVTLVHSDKVPMVPNFGQQPRFIVTIQPAGARFDPPARLTLPNVDGLAPGTVTEMYSFDHDLGHFISIGPATVAGDGRTLRSNPGVGVVKAGWHCGGNPDTSGSCSGGGGGGGGGCASAAGCEPPPDWNVVIDTPTEGQNFDMTTDPNMPRINAQARIDGNPPATPQITWHAELTLDGCSHQTAKKTHDPIADGSGTSYDVSISPVMSGDLKLTVEATANGDTKTAERRVVVRGANATCSDVVAQYGQNTYARKACLESGMRQFGVRDVAFDKCPQFSQDNAGGVGIGQITQPAPSFDDHFNWKTNVADSLGVLQGKAVFVDAYPQVLMGGSKTPNPGVPTNTALLALFNSFNTCRRNNRLAPLTRLFIPDLPKGGFGDSPGFYEQDLLRAYNGLCGPAYLGHSRHEFQLEQDPLCGLVLTVDEQTHTGTTNWVRVDPTTRCTGGCPSGARDYVTKVLSFGLPNCSHPAFSKVCVGDPNEKPAPAGTKCNR
ncbi:MAG TPA: DNRLRE domain-containing protein [Thermoanaerobaculia bacterium]|nr:DNRLRE domain-containing protein [Thermoanaerobaculia bacterium]